LPLFLRALPLSLQTFWRYLILLPFLVIAAFVLSVIGAFIPVVSYLVPAAVSAYCILMGLRCALMAHGHYNRPSNKQLLLASFVYGILHLVVSAAYILAVWAVIQFMPQFGITINGDTTVTSALVVLSLYYILISIYGSLIAVPMTEAAAAGSRGPDNGYFFGFGVGFFSLLPVTLVWAYGGKFFALFGEVWTISLMILGALAAMWQGKDIPWEGDLDLGYLIGGTLFMAWASSWFFATAVLAREKAGQQQKQDRINTVEAQRISGDDLRALRKSRQQGQDE